VPLYELRAWLAGTAAPEASDVEGSVESSLDQGDDAASQRRILRWAGPEDDRTDVCTATDQLRPGDTFVILRRWVAAISSAGTRPQRLRSLTSAITRRPFEGMPYFALSLPRSWAGLGSRLKLKQR